MAYDTPLVATVPVTTVASSGTTQTLTFAAAGDIAYDITLSTNCTFAVTPPSGMGTYRRLTLMIRPAGFQATLPASSGSLAWAGGSPPTPSTSAVTLVTFASDGTAPVLGGI